MSQTMQQEQGTATAEPRVRKDWELFWRTIAGLILLVIGWVAWVAYQIMPRSVVTPMAYATQVKPIGIQPSGSGTGEPALTAPPAASLVPAAPPIAADAAAGMTAQAASAETRDEPRNSEGLRLATELSRPPGEKQGMGTEAKPAGAAALPAAAGAAGKSRP